MCNQMKACDCIVSSTCTLDCYLNIAVWVCTALCYSLSAGSDALITEWWLQDSEHRICSMPRFWRQNM